MMGLLRCLLPELDIVWLEYLPNEGNNFGSDTKKSVYDVRCRLADGSFIIVEVQRSPQAYFADRILYYGSMQIANQKAIGDVSYELYPVYIISILDFCAQHGPDWVPKICSRYRIVELNGEDVFTAKLQIILVELGRFNKDLENCKTFEEKVYYCMRNMYLLEGQPSELNDEFFDELFTVTRVESMRAEEKTLYIKSMTTEIDIRNQIAYAREEGRTQGEAEGILQTAKKLLSAGVAMDIIMQCTGLDKNTILG